MSDTRIEPTTSRRAQPRHAGGRPRLPDTDRAILAAVTDLMAEVGASGTSINAVAARSGVARGTVYRRWPNRSAMIAAAVSESRGQAPLEPSGDLEADLRRHAIQAAEVLAEPAFRAMMPALMELMLKGGEPDPIVHATVFPARLMIRDLYRRLAGEAGLRTDVDPDVVNDAIVGPLLYRLLVTGKPPTAADAQRIVDLVLEGIRPRPTTG